MQQLASGSRPVRATEQAPPPRRAGLVAALLEFDPREHPHRGAVFHIGSRALNLLVLYVGWAVTMASLALLSRAPQDEALRTAFGGFIIGALILFGARSHRSFDFRDHLPFTPRGYLRAHVRLGTRFLVNMAALIALCGLCRTLEVPSPVAAGAAAHGAILFLILSYLELLHRAAPVGDEPVRGTLVFSPKKALERLRAVCERQKQRDGDARGPTFHVPWGGLLVPAGVLDPHYLLVGAPGSGKTLSIRMLMAAVLPREGDLRSRALVYDVKRDALPILVGLGIPLERIAILNPFDARSITWDLARDCTDRASAKQLANYLAPENKRAQRQGGANDNNLYFTKTARALLFGVIRAFQECSPGRWNLNDVVEACREPSRLRRVLSLAPPSVGAEDEDEEFKLEGPDLLKTHLDQHQKTTAALLSTLDTLVADYDIVAALWARRPPEQRVSLTEWLAEKDPTRLKVLVLGTDPTSRETLDPLIRLFIRRVSDILLSRTDENPPDLTWIFLDEARSAGELDGLDELMAQGRSKGVRCVLGVQDIEGLREAWTPQRANSITGLCGNIAFLRITEQETMTWAAKRVGEYEYWAASNTSGRNSSWQSGTQGSSSTHGTHSSTTHQLQKREAALASEFSALDAAGPHLGIPGFYGVPEVGVWKGRAAPEDIKLHLRDLADVQPFVKRDAKDQRRKAWTAEDERRLGLGPSENGGDDGSEDVPRPPKPPSPADTVPPSYYVPRV